MLTEDKKKLGKLVKERRKQLGLNQTQLSEMVGFRQGTISDLERGNKGVFSTALTCMQAMGLLEFKAKAPFSDDDFEFIWDKNWKENFL